MGVEEGVEEVKCRVGGYVERLRGETDGCAKIFGVPRSMARTIHMACSLGASIFICIFLFRAKFCTLWVTESRLLELSGLPISKMLPEVQIGFHNKQVVYPVAKRVVSLSEEV